MPLRRRLAVLSAAIVGVTVVLASIVCWLAMRSELRGQVDQALGDQAAVVLRAVKLRSAGLPVRIPPLSPADGGSAGYAQAVAPDGSTVPLAGAVAPLPVTPADRAAADGQARGTSADRTVRGVHVRVRTVPLPGGGAILLGRSLADVDSTLGRLRLLLIALCVLGTALAAVLGRVFSRPVIRPVADLTDAAGHIQRTGDLGRRVPAEGSDEVGRMAREFNAMLDALQHAQDAQRRLVADASHELRTPVASLRTNLELLTEGLGDPAERQAMLAAAGRQAEELSALVSDVIALSRDGEAPAEREEVRLDEVVAHAVARARLHAPQVRFAADLEPEVVSGVPERLGRAINNLLDNAAKHSPPGGEVEVRLRGGELTVRDHGAGIAPADLPHVFDRFYRGAGARGRAGSGLGLAIVRQVAQAHGGTVAAEPAPGGGACFRLRLPAVGVSAAGPTEPALYRP